MPQLWVLLSVTRFAWQQIVSWRIICNYTNTAIIKSKLTKNLPNCPYLLLFLKTKIYIYVHILKSFRSQTCSSPLVSLEPARKQESNLMKAATAGALLLIINKLIVLHIFCWDHGHALKLTSKEFFDLFRTHMEYRSDANIKRKFAKLGDIPVGIELDMHHVTWSAYWSVCFFNRWMGEKSGRKTGRRCKMRGARG